MPDMIQICSECNRPIEDQYIMRVADSILHEHCLRYVTNHQRYKLQGVSTSGIPEHLLDIR